MSGDGMMSDRFDEEWVEWRCSDCDPAFADDEPAEYDKPYVMALPRGEATPDYCPRCNSYLSMCEGGGRLHISNRPAERWDAERHRTALVDTLTNSDLRSADGAGLTPEVAQQLAEQVHAAARATR